MYLCYEDFRHLGEGGISTRLYSNNDLDTGSTEEAEELGEEQENLEEEEGIEMIDSKLSRHGEIPGRVKRPDRLRKETGDFYYSIQEGYRSGTETVSRARQKPHVEAAKLFLNLFSKIWL